MSTSLTHFPVFAAQVTQVPMIRACVYGEPLFSYEDRCRSGPGNQHPASLLMVVDPTSKCRFYAARKRIWTKAKNWWEAPGVRVKEGELKQKSSFRNDLSTSVGTKIDGQGN